MAPLVTFRIVFGALVAASTMRFLALGWVEDHYLLTQVRFTYYGFGWVPVPPPWGIYALHGVLLTAAVGVALGAWYRWAAAAVFVSFTWIELLDLTYYLNHYYFVSLVAGLLVLVPAHVRFSVDAARQPALRATHVPAWCIGLFQWQLAIVYVTAGLMKINPDWLVRGLPLRIWLPAHDALPLIGPLLRLPATAYAFSWTGMLYDLTIVAWLLWRPTRPWAYATVILFHVLTGLLFQIGVFPVVMIGATLIFFPAETHEKWLTRLGMRATTDNRAAWQPKPLTRHLLAGFLVAHLTFQLLFPWRFVLYPNSMFWSEEGYRFGWRVMLMEKAGTATFYVQDTRTGREGVVDNREFLRDHQEKQLAMQPDMLLQYAHWLGRHYAAQGVYRPRVRAEVYVTLNARPSRLLLDPKVDLMQIEDGWEPKTWVTPW